MIEKERIDHLYKYIEIDDEVLKFVNFPPLQRMFSRLSGISQLGLASKIFSSATHTKLEHNLGVYFLSDHLVNRASLPSDLIKPLSFKVAAMIHGVGHFPFSLATEVALQKASFLDKGVEDFITREIGAVVNRITNDINLNDQKIFNKDILQKRGNINHFYRFFTASLLLRNEKKLREILEGSSGFDFDELLRYLVLPQNIGFRLLHHIDRLDYILRDMFHLGLIEIDLNLPFYFANLRVMNNKRIMFPSEWEVLDKLESYAVQKVYNEQRVKAAEALYQKTLMKAIFDSKIALADLLDWRDKDLETKIEEYGKEKSYKHRCFVEIGKIKGEFDELLTYNLSLQEQKNTSQDLLFIEGPTRSIGSSLRKDIDMSTDIGVFKGSYPDSFDDISNVHINVVILQRKEIKYFLKVVAKYEKYYQETDKNQLAECIWGSSLTKIDFDRYRPVVERLIEQLKQQRGLTAEGIFPGLMSIGSRNLPEGVTLQDFRQIMMTVVKLSESIDKQKGSKYLADTVDDIITYILLKNPERALLDERLISLFKFSDQENFLDFVRLLCNKRIKTVKNFKGRAWEYYTYLKKVCQPEIRPDQIRKWVFPSTITNRGEIDVWGLYTFRDKKPLIEIIECSTARSGGKKLEAGEKLRQKRAFLQERFEKKVDIRIFFNDEEIAR
ncbi:MAG: hypothetical protein KAV99_01000 [Candidatus Latescibacteria bacterium]|nr:hypothetical protein [Candidatus Latescibacterota bacterium]